MSMRQPRVLACIVFLLLVLILVVFSVEYRPHAFAECSTCHAMKNPIGDASRTMIEPITLICTRCHRKIFTEGYLHPVDVRPEFVRVPADMPLASQGEITCATCHDVHSDYVTPYGAPSHFLRRQELGRVFCRICHGNLTALSRGHMESLGEAHFRSQHIAADLSQELDPMSRDCVSCHDGTYASSVTIRAGTWIHGKDFMRYDQGRHPVGMDYEAVRLKRGSKTDLLPLPQVDRRIRFFNGKVGCGSCHDPYSAIPKKLVMSDRNSRLCFSCHIV